MNVTPESVAGTREWVRDRNDVIVPLINEVREDLGAAFRTTVDPVTGARYREEVDAVFADGPRAVNVATLVDLLRDLDVAGDYPGFVVDELLGRRLASFVAGGGALATLAEATFHYADVHTHGDADAAAGLDDLDAALAAGAQTRLPGWPWREEPSPYAVERDG